MKKNKIKTHKATKKTLNVRDGGSISIYHQGLNHNTGKKNSSFNRRGRKSAALSKADANRLKKVQF